MLSDTAAVAANPVTPHPIVEAVPNLPGVRGAGQAPSLPQLPWIDLP
jgi:hypothetical protein